MCKIFSFFIAAFVFFWDTVLLCSSGRPWIHCEAQAALKLSIFLPQPSRAWDHMLGCSFFVLISPLLQYLMTTFIGGVGTPTGLLLVLSPSASPHPGSPSLLHTTFLSPLSHLCLLLCCNSCVVCVWHGLCRPMCMDVAISVLRRVTRTMHTCSSHLRCYITACTSRASDCCPRGCPSAACWPLLCQADAENQETALWGGSSSSCFPFFLNKNFIMENYRHKK